MGTKRKSYSTLRARVDALGDALSGWRKRHRPFSRAYARYDWPNSFLPELDRRIAIAPAQRFVWIRVPKAANSTIARTLWAALHPGAQGAPRGDDAKRWFERPSALDAEAVAQVEGFYKFMIVRNPFTRALAAYLDKAGHRKCGYKIRRRPVTPGEPPVDFRGFCEYLAAGGVNDDPHWCVQARLSPFPIERLDTVGYVESLESDLARIVTELLPERDNPQALVPALGHATGASGKVPAYYGEAERRLIAQAYAEDFEHFGYDPGRLPA